MFWKTFQARPLLTLSKKCRKSCIIRKKYFIEPSFFLWRFTPSIPLPKKPPPPQKKKITFSPHNMLYGIFLELAELLLIFAENLYRDLPTMQDWQKKSLPYPGNSAAYLGLPGPGVQGGEEGGPAAHLCQVRQTIRRARGKRADGLIHGCHASSQKLNHLYSSVSFSCTLYILFCTMGSTV